MAHSGVHSPGFLEMVNDAKSRVQQIDIEGYRKMLAAGEPHVLVDSREDNEWAAGHAAGAVHLGKGIIERDIEAKVPDKDTRWCSIAAADSAPRWPPTTCRRWATPTPSRSMADGKPGDRPACLWRAGFSPRGA